MVGKLKIVRIYMYSLRTTQHQRLQPRQTHPRCLLLSCTLQGRGVNRGKLLASSVSLGQVVSEPRRACESGSRATRWYIGERIELGHRIGVPEGKTEVTSRFTVRWSSRPTYIDMCHSPE